MGERQDGSESKDNGDEREAVDIDNLLRLEFDRAMPDGEQVDHVLAGLAPVVTQARRRRLAGQIAVGTMTCLLLFGGLGIALRALPGSDQKVTFAGEREDGLATDVTEPGEDGDPRATLEVTGSTISVETDTTSTNADGDQESPSPESSPRPTDPPAGGQSTTAATAPPFPTRTTSSSPWSAGASTIAGTTPSTMTDGSGTDIDSPCGTITVSVSGEDVMLEDVRPAPGYTHEVKGSGPESIEVSLTNGRRECELKAKVEDGELEIEGAG